eukprot:6547206-Prymnesium_polylepis.1
MAFGVAPASLVAEAAPARALPAEPLDSSLAERAGWPAAQPGCKLPNYLCKDASSDWPLPCQWPLDAYDLKFGAEDDLPIGAWWPPVCAGSKHNPLELAAYAAANFSLIMVARNYKNPNLRARTRDGCGEANALAEMEFTLDCLDNIGGHGARAAASGGAVVARGWSGLTEGLRLREGCA